MRPHLTPDIWWQGSLVTPIVRSMLSLHTALAAEVLCTAAFAAPCALLQLAYSRHEGRIRTQPAGQLL